MKKRLTSLLLCLLLVSLLFTIAYAEDGDRSSSLPLIVDEADLLTDEEESALASKAEEISSRQKCELIIYTTKDLAGQNIVDYSDEILDRYGYGADRSAFILVVYYPNTGDGDNMTHTAGSGKAIKVFSDQDMDDLFYQIEDELVSKDFNGAFNKYLSLCDRELTRSKPKYVLIWIIALLLGFLLSLIPLAVMKQKIQNVSKQMSAANYEREGSMNLTTNRDIFLYANTASRVINTGNRGSGGGGTTTHVTHSGSVHSGSTHHF